jgi:RNA polymerase sigma-B factor
LACLTPLAQTWRPRDEGGDAVPVRESYRRDTRDVLDTPGKAVSSPWPSAREDPDAQALAAVAHLDPADPVRRRVRDQVVTANLPLARRLAGCFAGRGEPIDDLYQVASLALIRAADRFDTRHDVSFAGFAGPTILGELRHHFRDTRWHLRVDRRLQELYLAVRQADEDLAQELGHHPDTAQIADRVGAEPADCARAIAVSSAFQPLSLNRPLDSDPSAGDLGDVLGTTDNELESVTDRFALGQVVAELSEDDQRLLALRFFGNLTQAEIATRLGVSQMQVSRLLSALLSKLRAALMAE